MIEQKTLKASKEEANPGKKQKLKRNIKRTPFHKQKRIGIKQEAGYHYRLVNDIGNNIISMQEGGYEVVDGPIREGEKDAADTSQMGKTARQDVGNGMEAVYMRIPKEWYDEDQKEKQSSIDLRDSQLGLDKIPESVRRGKVQIDYGPPEGD